MKNARFGEGSGPILLDDLHCTGSEASLLDCNRSAALYASNCEHREDAGVRCQGAYAKQQKYSHSLHVYDVQLIVSLVQFVWL